MRTATLHPGGVLELDGKFIPSDPGNVDAQRAAREISEGKITVVDAVVEARPEPAPDISVRVAALEAAVATLQRGRP